MSYFYSFIAGAWVLFWLYWLASAFRAKRSHIVTYASVKIRVLVAVVIFISFRSHWVNGRDATIHDPALQAAGTLLLLAGLGFAVWARIYLGRNWGMPMTRVEDRELVTAGPYGLVRHPIYSGLLLAMIGTALATTLYWLIALAAMGFFFIYSAVVEERMMGREFPKAYPAYKSRTKMLIPFVW